jgi:rhodanese-related sulfurtransferase
MRKTLLALSALSLTSLLAAYGVSPSQAGAGQAPQNANQGFQIQPAPQPSNNLMGGPAPAPGAPGQQPFQIQPQGDNIQQNIANYQPDEWAKAWGHIHLDEAKKLQADTGVLFADARAKVEYDQGHIPGAIPLPLGEFDQYYEKYKSRIKAAKKIVTYCHGVGCKLSDKVAQKLYNDKGHKNVVGFFGGWPQWQQNNLPIETGPEPKKR